MLERKVTPESLKPNVLCLRTSQDRDTGVCVFPNCQELLVGSFRLGLVS